MPVAPRAQAAFSKALVVDDDVGICSLFSRQLTRLGIKSVRTAGDGADAMRVLEEPGESFDVVLCDLRMPNEDGLVLLRRMAALERPPAVILVSGEDPIFLDAAKRLGLGHNLRVLGVVGKPHTLSSLAELLTDADATTPMGRAHTVALPQFDGAAIESALETGQMEVWFQPQLDLATRQVVGAEALLRLRHPQAGVLSPGTFMCAVEKHGLLAAVTRFVLSQAVSWSRAWHADGVRLSVSVNVSATTMHDLTYPDAAANLCAAHGVRPKDIVFELTESALARDPVALLDIMTRLRLKGFRVSIDDFGTGYSSLELLRMLPFNELKVDHTLVQDAVRDTRARLILRNNVAMAAQLGMTTVAEGVESEGALELVTCLGCDLAQGFHIGRPMPAIELAGWLSARRAAGGTDPQAPPQRG